MLDVPYALGHGLTGLWVPKVPAIASDKGVSGPIALPVQVETRQVTSSNVHCCLVVCRQEPKWGVELVNDPPATAGLLASFRQTHTFEAPGLFHVLNDSGKGSMAGGSTLRQHPSHGMMLVVVGTTGKLQCLLAHNTPLGH